MRRNDTEWHVPSAVVIVAVEHGLVPVKLALEAARVRVDQQFMRIAAQAAARVVRTMDTVAVPLSRLTAGKIAVPDTVVVAYQVESPRCRALVIKQAQLDPLRWR